MSLNSKYGWILLFGVLLMSAMSVSAQEYGEAPEFRELVTAGALPPVEDRIPEIPYVVEPVNAIGRYGGTIRTASVNAEGNGDDTRIMGVPGFMKPDPETFDIIPQVPAAMDASEDRSVYTMRMRPGMKWSDGEPFNADDILFWFESVMLNEDLRPVIGVNWRAQGEIVQVAKLDEYTVEFRFAYPKPYFRESLVHFWEWYPKHYMQQFHPDYQDPDVLAEMVSEAGFDNWWELFGNRAQTVWGTPLHVGQPTLAAYVIVQKTSDRRVYERNPYFWKIDTAGNQLPYVERVDVAIVSDREVIQGQIISGALDFAGMPTDIRNYPMYRQSEEVGDFRTLLWTSGQGSEVIYMFNMTHEDPYLREVFQDVRFRRAMSLGINRQEISDVVYFGRAEPRQYTVLDVSRFYKPEFADAYTEYDPARANLLLDEMGLTERDGEGYRLLANGERLAFTIEFVDITTAKVPNVELVTEYWKELGVDARSRQISGELAGQRAPANLMDATLWHGDKASDVLFPVQAQFFTPHGPGWERSKWPLWGLWAHTGGTAGEEPPQEVQDLRVWWEELVDEPNPERQLELGHRILQAQADNLWTIGTIGRAPHPLIVNNDLRNIRDNGLWVWDTVHLATHDPSQIFFDR